jgi:hypothetical protein
MHLTSGRYPQRAAPSGAEASPPNCDACCILCIGRGSCASFAEASGAEAPFARQGRCNRFNHHQQCWPAHALINVCVMTCTASPSTHPAHHGLCCLLHLVRREWLRHQKTQRLPEPLATRSQLDRLRELQLPVTAAAAATLTYTQVRLHIT